MSLSELQDTTELQDRLHAFLRRREPRYFELLKRMVDINSFTANKEGIASVARLTAEAFAELGFESESVPSEEPEYGDHLVMTRKARRGDSPPKIGFVSHLDTVFPAEEEERNNFAWREDGDKIYGPGTVDIKGGTVVIYMMMEALQAEAPEIYDSVTWVVLLNSAEERMAVDFGPLCHQHLDVETTKACLVFEGGYMKGEGEESWVVVGRKGMACFRVEVEGRASHSGTAHPWGANAVVQMADVIRRIDSWTDYDRELTFNVGVVHGGTVTNRVPHEAVAQIEMRTYKSEVFDDAMAKMLSLRDYSTRRSVEGDFPCAVGCEVTMERSPWPRNPGTDGLLEVWRQAAADLGMKVTPEVRGGLSDGNVVWEGLPTLDGLGPSGSNAHCSEQAEDGSKEQEYATRSSFVPKALINLGAILRLV